MQRQNFVAFDKMASEILFVLGNSFPKPVNINAATLNLPNTLEDKYSEGDLIDEKPTPEEKLFADTLKWLRREEYLYGLESPNGDIRSVVLTAKGLRTQGWTPPWEPAPRLINR